jgi:hypothetical protein
MIIMIFSDFLEGMPAPRNKLALKDVFTALKGGTNAGMKYTL